MYLPSYKFIWLVKSNEYVESYWEWMFESGQDEREIFERAARPQTGGGERDSRGRSEESEECEWLGFDDRGASMAGDGHHAHNVTHGGLTLHATKGWHSRVGQGMGAIMW